MGFCLLKYLLYAVFTAILVVCMYLDNVFLPVKVMMNSLIHESNNIANLKKKNQK